MKKMEVVKAVVGVIVSVSVGAVIKNAVSSTTPGATKGLSKLIVGIGTLAISSLISDKVVTYTDEQFDSVTEQIEKAMEENQDEVIIE